MDLVEHDLGYGRKVYRIPAEHHVKARSHLACPQIVRPFAASVQSMADGKWYDNPRDLERTYKASGNPRGEEFIPLGNETLKFPDVVPDPKERRADLRRALADVKSGNIAPEIAAIE